jgi:ubiquinone biosynthesis protein Coq4
VETEFETSLRPHPAAIPGLDIPAFLQLIENPYETQSVFDLYGHMVKSGRFNEVNQCYMKAAEKDSALLELYANRYHPRFPTKAELLKMPPGSLGWHLGRHLEANAITPDFQGIDTTGAFAKQETFAEYARMRGLRLHDVLHVLLGVDTSPIGEGQVSAFAAAQYCHPFHTTILSYTFAHLLFFQPESVHDGLKAINRAFSMGLKAQPYYGVPWEDYLSDSLESLRRRFGFLQ